MSDLIAAVLISAGSALLAIAALGVVRMPDVFTRIQAGTKASTLGIALQLLALGVHFGDTATFALSFAAVAFFLLTAPVSAHMISRAAYFVRTPMWERTGIDELRGRYNLETHELSPQGSLTETDEELRLPGSEEQVET